MVRILTLYAPISQNEIFSQKTTIKIFMYLLTPFILQIFKKILEWIQSYEDAPFLGPKGSICPKQTLIWPFLTIFGRFCPLIFFLKNPALSHTTIYEPPTPCQVSEKTTELIPRENADRRKDGWTDPIL